MTISISTPSSSEEGDFTLEDVIPDTKNNMEEKQRVKNKILYWTILLNPVIIVLFYKCIKVKS